MLDSRGRPTLAVTLRLPDGRAVRAGVPSGASTGSREAVEQRLGGRVQLAGDDLLVTNPVIVAETIAGRAANAALIKVNQIGTVTETMETMRLCQRAGWA